MSHRHTAIPATATAAALALALTSCGNVAAPEGTATGDGEIVITYNSPTEWGNYGRVLSTFTERTGIQAPNDPKNSGQALAALQAEKGAPVADRDVGERQLIGLHGSEHLDVGLGAELTRDGCDAEDGVSTACAIA